MKNKITEKQSLIYLNIIEREFQKKGVGCEISKVRLEPGFSPYFFECRDEFNKLNPPIGVSKSPLALIKKLHAAADLPVPE